MGVKDTFDFSFFFCVNKGNIVYLQHNRVYKT